MSVPAPQAQKDTLQLYRQLQDARSQSALIKIDKLPRATKQSLAQHSMRLAVVTNSTPDFILPVLRACGLQRGVYVETISHDYGQALAVTLDPQSALYSEAEAILVCFDYRMLEMNAEEAARIVTHLKANARVPLFIQTVPNPPFRLFGNEEARQPQGLRRRVHEFNTLAIEKADYLVDTAYLADYIGLSRWYNETYYHMAKVPFDFEYLPQYGRLVADSLALSLGRFGKCLVLDLDNTLWGGVVGDDGVEGLELGQQSPAGEAFLQFQKTILQFQKRGVILAVCSKNNEKTARAVFQQHPEMLIREEHISAFVANWNDKASNLRHIAKTLNIGLDSLVFVDDNPAEREQVRQQLPEVTVIDLPENPADYSRALMFSGALESKGLTDDDLRRTEQYAQLRKAEELLVASDNYDDYLKSLGMTGSIQPFDDMGRQRIAQLINKTNQFNLTTRRYTEEDVARMATAPDYLTYQVRLADKFGDHGMIGVVIMHLDGGKASIDTWLMSCRVLKRGVESMVMNRVVQDAAASGATEITGTYIRTPKNEMVAEFYKQFGFALTSEEDGKSAWTLSIPTYVPQPNYIKQG